MLLVVIAFLKRVLKTGYSKFKIFYTNLRVTTREDPVVIMHKNMTKISGSSCRGAVVNESD